MRYRNFLAILSFSCLIRISKSITNMNFPPPHVPERPATRIVWPPKIFQNTALGYLYDSKSRSTFLSLITDTANTLLATGNWYPRDIGRSTALSNGMILYQFGDTFCHNQTGGFLGVADNTCSVVKARDNPTLSAYYPQAHHASSSHPPGEVVLESFIKRPEEQDTENVMWKIWAFSGIVELEKIKPGGSVLGVTFYELRKWEKNPLQPQLEKYRYQYTGIAQVEYDPKHGHVFKVSRGLDSQIPLFKASDEL